MIQTNNPELDAIINELQAQRNSALDGMAILTGKLKVQEKLTADANEKLLKALQPEASQEPNDGRARND